MSRTGDEVKTIAYLLGIGGFFFWRGFRDLKLHKKMAGLATSRARSMAMGLVELSGMAKSASTLRTDPVYSKPCCYFRLKVEQYRRSGKRGSWVTIHEDSSDGTPFLCRDQTGEVLILPKKPEVHFVRNLVFGNSLFAKKDAAVTAFLHSRWSSWSSLRLTLDVLREGDPIYVLGCALARTTTLAPSGDVPKTISIAEVARDLKKNPDLMKGLDTNHDGQVDAQEWDIGVEKYRAFLESKRVQALQPQAVKEPLVFQGIVTASDEHDLIFATSEDHLSSKLGPLAYLKVIGGAVAVIVGLVLIAHRLNL